LATYFVVPDLVVSVTFGSTRTFFTHWDSPPVDARFFTPSTSTGVTGIFCGCLLALDEGQGLAVDHAGRHREPV
jgi:hypothetical protein